MTISIKVPHRIEAIPLICSFVSETAKYYGAEANESFELSLVAEEAATHIIKTYPLSESGAPFDIFCEQKDDSLRLILSNSGLPVDVESIPEYDVNNPESSIDGLPFFLLEKLTDDFRFVNLGTDGWQTVIVKKLNCLRIPCLNASAGEEIKALPSGNVEISIALPDDAYEITKIAYYTYRYSYAKKIFYYPEMLKESLVNQQIISFVGKDEKGEVVAHAALIRSENCKQIAEVGAIMAKPEYRRTTVVLRLVEYTYDFITGPDNRGVCILESNLVTTHTGSQKISRSFKFIPLALKISVHEKAQFIDINDIALERESLLYSILPNTSFESFAFYCPGEHRNIIHKLLDKTGLEFNEIDAVAPKKIAGKSQFLSQRDGDAKFARIVVIEVGEDLFEEIKKISYQLSIEDIVTIALSLPLCAPLPESLDNQLGSMDFFFSGIIPSTPGKWQILYTRLIGHEIHFDQIKVADELAVELKDYIEKIYLALIP